MGGHPKILAAVIKSITVFVIGIHSKDTSNLAVHSDYSTTLYNWSIPLSIPPFTIASGTPLVRVQPLEVFVIDKCELALS